MTHPAESKTFDEIEAELAAADNSGKNVLEAKLEGDSVPEDMRGKTVGDLTTDAGKLKEALRISEEARQQAEGRGAQLEARMAAMEVVQPSQMPSPTPPESPVELTDEQLRELYDKDPLAAIQAINERATTRLEKNLAARIDPLSRTSADVAEQGARERYATEFELFGDQIAAQLKMIPDRSVMSAPRAWDDLIAYIRGKPENFTTLTKQAATKTAAEAEAQAQAAADAAAGASVTAATHRAPTDAPQAGQMDDTKKEIAKTLGMTDADYLKWEKMG